VRFSWPQTGLSEITDYVSGRLGQQPNYDVSTESFYLILLAPAMPKEESNNLHSGAATSNAAAVFSFLKDLQLSKRMTGEIT
jgi:hypothetical protein